MINPDVMVSTRYRHRVAIIGDGASWDQEKAMDEGLPREVVISMAAELFGFEHWPRVGDCIDSEMLGGWVWTMFCEGDHIISMVLQDVAKQRQGIKVEPITALDVWEFELICESSRAKGRLM